MMRLILTSILFLVGLAAQASAQDAGEMIREIGGIVGGEAAEGSQLSGRIIQIFGLITVLGIAPGLAIMTTSFTKYVIVLSMLRSAMGLNQTPPNMVVTSLAMFMTFFVMKPVFTDAYENGLNPLLQDSITEEQALGKITEPFKAFMYDNAD
mgnify:CR=1 FL=1